MKNIEELRRACNALYLEVPAPVGDDVKAKAEAVIKDLEQAQERLEWLDCLEAAGVDNWQGIDIAFDIREYGKI